VLKHVHLLAHAAVVDDAAAQADAQRFGWGGGGKGCGVWGEGCVNACLGFRVWVLGFRVWGFTGVDASASEDEVEGAAEADDSRQANLWWWRW